MERSWHVTVEIDLERIARNGQEIRRQAGVPVIAVVKADAYGLGALAVVKHLAEVVDRFCFFSLREAMEAQLLASGKAGMTLGPPDADGYGAEMFMTHGVRPAVWTVEQAAALTRARPILAVDTGMQRFACPVETTAAVSAAGGCEEAFTHATTLNAVRQLRAIAAANGGRWRLLHAAGTQLLHEAEARLDAVRPGLALYRGAARVSCRLADARASLGPVGYTRFASGRHGVILAGYSHGMGTGTCLINGQTRRIVEVGMQSSYVELAAHDKTGDEVVLLGDTLDEEEVAREGKISPQQALVRLTGMGQRRYASRTVLGI